MTMNHTEASPTRKARIAGVLYLIVIVTAGFAEAFARGKLVVPGDAAATANNILTHEMLYRAGGAADLVNFVCDVALALLFYQLLRPVSRSFALPMAAFRMMGDGLGAFITFLHFGVLVLLTNAPYLIVFSPAQVQAQALMLLRLHSQGYNVAMVFFGVHCVLLGYLIYRSRFWPRFVGVVLSISGLCYLFNSFARFLAPAFAARLSPYILLPGVLAEASVMVMLLVGVKEDVWFERAGVPRSERMQTATSR